MSNSCNRFSVNCLRATLSVVAATAMFALSDADSNDQLQHNNGFLYSQYLQSPNNNTKYDFSVNNQLQTPWKDAVSYAENAVHSLPLTQYFAQQLFNDKQPALRQAANQLSLKSWELGANLIELGVQSAAKETLGRAFRKAEVHVETQKGRGAANAGLNVVGALHETDKRALAWQLRAFSGFEDSRVGGNLGLMLRSISQQTEQEVLFGGNAFLDYESLDSDAFLRWSFGAEMRSEWIDAFANKYIAIDDPVNKENGAWVYSPNGYDLQLHAHSPKLPVLTGVLGYYLWEGEREQSDDSGLLAGFRITPWQLPLKVKVEYRSGKGENVSGEVNYAYEFGANDVQTQNKELAFKPEDYFFASAEREYSQQIIQVAAPPTPARPIPDALNITQLDGFAGVRAVTVTVITNLGLRGFGNQISIEGVLQNNNTTAVETLPWQLPNATRVAVNTFANSTMQIQWQGGSGRNAIIGSNSSLNVAINAMQMFAGQVQTSAERGFVFVAPNNITISLRGGAQFDVNVNPNNSGMVSVSGRFVMNVGNVSYQNDGRRAGGVSIAFDSNGAITLRRVTSGDIIFDDGSGMLTITPPEPLGISVRVNPDLPGDGTQNSPIFMPINYFSGFIASVSPVGGFNGLYEISPASQGFMTISADGNIAPLVVLQGGTYHLGFDVSRGEEQSTFTVYFSVGNIVTVTASSSAGSVIVPGSLPGNDSNPTPQAGVLDVGTSDSLDSDSNSNSNTSPIVAPMSDDRNAVIMSDSAEKSALRVCDSPADNSQLCQRQDTEPPIIAGS